MSTDKTLTLEVLENEVWPPPGDTSYLVATCHALRKKPLCDFETEDLRIMIGQNMGLTWLIPMAIAVLKKDILAAGHFYPGDLLLAVLGSDDTYWKKEPENWNSVCTLFRQNQALLDTCETSRSIRKAWFDRFDTFQKHLLAPI